VALAGVPYANMSQKQLFTFLFIIPMLLQVWGILVNKFNLRYHGIKII
jgi:hypothetical protein